MNRHKLQGTLLLLASITLMQTCKLTRVDPGIPKIKSISPGGATMGEVITIKGSNFAAGHPGLYTVRIGGQPIPNDAILEVPDAETLRFKVPKGIGNGEVTVALTGMPNADTAQHLNFVYYYTATRVLKFFELLNNPMGLDFDNIGNVVVADRNNNQIKVIYPGNDFTIKGQLVTTHGSGETDCEDTANSSDKASFDAPNDVDADGNIYIAVGNNAVIRVINLPPIKSVDVFAGVCNFSTSEFIDGPRNGIKLNYPQSIARDGSDIYFIDGGNLRKIDGARDNVKPLRLKKADEEYVGIEISRSRPDAGPIFVADANKKMIMSLDIGGAASEINMSSPNLLKRPYALAIDSKGNIYIADWGNNQIFVLYKNGVLRLLAGSGSPGITDDTAGLAAKFSQPSGIIVNEKDGLVYVSDSQNSVIRVIKIE